MPVDTSIKFRKGSSSQWNNINPVLASGEPGFDITANILKIGDGVNSWTNLNSISFTGVDLGTYPLITITSQPASITGSINSNVSFSITASSSFPTKTINYQWQKSSDNISFTNIVNSTSSSLSINNIQSTDTGYYRCYMTSDLSYKYSNSATLTTLALNSQSYVYTKSDIYSWI